MTTGETGNRQPIEPDYLKRQIIRARITLGDLEESIEYLTVFDANQIDPIRRGLLLAAIVSYCRPFFQNDGGPNNEATPQYGFHTKDLFNEEENQLHEYLKELRKKVLAHSDFESKPVGITHVAEHGFTTSAREFDLLSAQIDTSKVLGLCRKVKQDCVNKMFALSKVLARKPVSTSVPLQIDGSMGLNVETAVDFSVLSPKIRQHMGKNPGQKSVTVNLHTGEVIDNPDRGD